MAGYVESSIPDKALAEPFTRPEAIRGMIETMLHIFSKDSGEKPAKKAKIR
jgi:hypothetical protein